MGAKMMCQGRVIGSYYMTENKGQQAVRMPPFKKSWPGSCAVFQQGDGTLEGDTVCLGLFWQREKAELFLKVLKEAQG